MDSLPVNVGASISKSTPQAPTVPNVPIPTMDTTPAAEKTEATIHRKILPKPPGIELIKTNSLSTLSDQELIKKLPKTSYYRMINLMKEGKDISKFLMKYRLKCPYCFQAKTEKFNHHIFNDYVFCPSNPYNHDYEQWLSIIKKL